MLTVCAAPMMSLRSRMAGSKHSRWMGVGSSNPRPAIAAITPEARPRPCHASMLPACAAGASAPDALSCAEPAVAETVAPERAAVLPVAFLGDAFSADTFSPGMRHSEISVVIADITTHRHAAHHECYCHLLQRH